MILDDWMLRKDINERMELHQLCNNMIDAVRFLTTSYGIANYELNIF